MTDDLEKYGHMDILGETGLKRQGGEIYEEYLTRLQGMNGIRLYGEMINHSTIGAVRYLIRALVRQIKWRVEPADESPKAQEQAEYVEGAFTDMDHTFEDFISEALSCLDFGWAYFETVLKLRKGQTNDPTTNSDFNDGKWGWRKIEIRSQASWERWVFDYDTGDLLGMYQQNPYTGKRAFIPLEKAVHFLAEKTRGNPEGRSLYRSAVTDYHYLKRICQIEAVGIERDMTGLLVMQVPIELLLSNAPADLVTLRNSLETMLGSLKRDEREFALIPPKLDRNGNPTGFELELLHSGGRRQVDTNDTKRYFKISMLQTVLAQFIELGMDKVGALSLASSFTSTFSIALGAILDDSIAGPINNVLIPRLLTLNGVPTELHPTLVHADIETPSLEELGKYLTSLAGAGFDLTDPALERKVLEIGNLPVPTEEEQEERRQEREEAAARAAEAFKPNEDDDEADDTKDDEGDEDEKGEVAKQ